MGSVAFMGTIIAFLKLNGTMNLGLLGISGALTGGTFLGLKIDLITDIESFKAYI